MHHCCVCHEPIQPERLEALPDTTTCTKHSQTQKVVGFQSYGHKTAPALVTVNPNDKEALRLARRAHRRSR